MGEIYVLNGMVYCADCGSKMYQLRYTSKREKDYLVRSSYKKKKQANMYFSSNPKREAKKLILEDLQRITFFMKKMNKSSSFVFMKTMLKVKCLLKDLKTYRYI